MNPLHDHLARRRLALFVGGDLPSALTGLPSRAELAAGLAQRHGLAAGLSLAAAAQRTAAGGNRFAFTDFLGRQLDSHGKQPQEVHRLLAALGTPIIVTTAYDDLLERAFAQAGIAINRVVRDADLGFVDAERPTLIRLYGDLQQRDTLVVTEDDHYALWRSKANLLDEVRAILRRYAVLFVGYDLNDPDVMLLWREVLDRMGRFALGAYAIAPSMPADERAVWAGRQVRVLEGEVVALLEGLTMDDGRWTADRGPQTEDREPQTADREASGAGRGLGVEREGLAAEVRASLQRRLETHTLNLMALREQAAGYGPFDVPLRLLNQIRAEERAIAELHQQIDGGA